MEVAAEHFQDENAPGHNVCKQAPSAGGAPGVAGGVCESGDVAAYALAQQLDPAAHSELHRHPLGGGVGGGVGGSSSSSSSCSISISSGVGSAGARLHTPRVALGVPMFLSASTLHAPGAAALPSPGPANRRPGFGASGDSSTVLSVTVSPLSGLQALSDSDSPSFGGAAGLGSSLSGAADGDGDGDQEMTSCASVRCVTTPPPRSDGNKIARRGSEDRMVLPPRPTTAPELEPGDAGGGAGAGAGQVERSFSGGGFAARKGLAPPKILTCLPRQPCYGEPASAPPGLGLSPSLGLGLGLSLNTGLGLGLALHSPAGTDMGTGTGTTSTGSSAASSPVASASPCPTVLSLKRRRPGLRPDLLIDTFSEPGSVDTSAVSSPALLALSGRSPLSGVGVIGICVGAVGAVAAAGAAPGAAVGSAPHSSASKAPAEPPVSEILDGFLSIGALASISREPQVLEQFSAFINASRATLPLPPDAVELRLCLRDKASEDISATFYSAVDMIERCRAQRRKVLVYCQRGISRSATIVLAYLIWQSNLSYEEALAFVKRRRPSVNPNVGFCLQLMSWAQLRPSTVMGRTLVYKIARSGGQTSLSVGRDQPPASLALAIGPVVELSSAMFDVRAAGKAAQAHAQHQQNHHGDMCSADDDADEDELEGRDEDEADDDDDGAEDDEAPSHLDTQGPNARCWLACCPASGAQFVWFERGTPSALVDDACVVAAQLAALERAPHNVVKIEQGSETPAFWAAIAGARSDDVSLSPSMIERGLSLR